MANQYTEVSSRGWLSRIGGAIKGVLVGLVLTVVAFPLLFWNEGRAVAREKALDEGAAAVVKVDAARIDPQNEGKLVHLSGTAQTSEILEDSEFGVRIGALRLLREVSMYQWVEKEKSETRTKLGGGEETVTVYTYEKEWKDSLVSSGSFRYPDDHRNPSSMPYTDLEAQAQDVRVGAFRLNDSQVQRVGTPVDLPADTALTLPPGQQGAQRQGSSTVYIGANPGSPQVGDVKVVFRYVPASDVSVVAGQTGETLGTYITSSGGDIDLLEDGLVGAEQMFQIAQDENTMLTWILRGAGFVLMFIGLAMIFKPLSVLADVVPLFGRIVGFGTGLISFLLAFAGSFVTIAIAWVFYRPLIGLPLLALGAGALVYTFAKIKETPAATPATSASTA